MSNTNPSAAPFVLTPSVVNDVFDDAGNIVVPVPDFPIELPADYDPLQTSVNVTVRTSVVCPAGYICNTTHQASCLEIRQAAIEYFQYGDIHAGAYCPEGSPFYLECPLGFYCPDAVSFSCSHSLC